MYVNDPDPKSIGHIKYAISLCASGTTPESTEAAGSISTPENIDNAASRLAAIVESSDDSIIGMTLDGTILSWNTGAQNMYGYEPEEAIGHHVSIVVPEEHPEQVSTILGQIARGEKVDHYETERITKDGKRINISLTVSPIRDSSGNIIGASSIARDITKRKQSEDILKRYQLLSEHSRDIILVVRRDGRIIEANQAALDAYGYNREEILSMTIYDVRALDESEIVSSQMDTADGSGLLFEARHKRRDGSIFPVEVSSQGATIGNERVLVSIVRDITERKQAEEEREKLLWYLRERTKELNCLYQVTNLGQIPDITEDELMRRAVNLLPPAWQYPDITEGQIIYKGREYRTNNYYDTEWKQTADIIRGREKVGTVTVCYTEAKPHYDEGPFLQEERYLIDTIARTLGVIVERKQSEEERERAKIALEEVYRREKRIAETLQRNFLPEAIPQVPGYDIAEAYYPALDEAAIGGDMYDVFRLPDGKVGIVIADVSGKGLQAARYGAMVKYMLRAYAYRTDDPAQVLTMLNDSITGDLAESIFITCFFGVLDPISGIFTYANAGHNEPFQISPRFRKPFKLDVTGRVIGLAVGIVITSRKITLQSDDCLFLYTDGVTDARGVERRMDTEGLEELLTNKTAYSASEVLQEVMKEVRRRSGDKLADDVAMIALKVLSD